MDNCLRPWVEKRCLATGSYISCHVIDLMTVSGYGYLQLPPSPIPAPWLWDAGRAICSCEYTTWPGASFTPPPLPLYDVPQIYSFASPASSSSLPASSHTYPPISRQTLQQVHSHPQALEIPYYISVPASPLTLSYTLSTHPSPPLPQRG